MKTCKVLFEDEKEEKGEINNLLKIRDNHKSSNDNIYSTNDVKKICIALLLRIDNCSFDTIIKKTGKSRTTINNYISRYQKNKSFMLNKKNTLESDLQKYVDRIAEDFKINPVASYSKALTRIEKITGIKKSKTRVFEFLKKNHFEKTKGFILQNQTKKEKIDISSYIDEHKDEMEKLLDKMLPNSPQSARNILRKYFPSLENATDEKLTQLIREIFVF